MSCPEIIIAWLEDHVSVSSPQLVIETESYYGREAFRASIWRMAHRYELRPTEFEGYYTIGSKPFQSRPALTPEEKNELLLLVPCISSYEELGRLYGISRYTVGKYVSEHRHPSRTIRS